MILKTLAAAWDRFWFEPTSTSAICLFRIFFGLVTFANGIYLIPDYLMWFGPRGVVTFDTIVRDLPPLFCIWSFVPILDANATYAVLGAYLLFALLTCIGLWTRFGTIMMLILIVSIRNRNPWFWHSVDLVLYTIAPMLAMSQCGEKFSVDAWLKKRKDKKAVARLFPPWPQRLMQFQMAAFYMRAFCAKLYGDTWHQGTAVYYASHCDWSRFGMPFFLENSFGYRMATWGTLIIEFSLFTLIWNRRFRYLVLAAGLVLHLMIEWSMNLDLLEWSIVFGYVLWIYPDDLDRLLDNLRISGGKALQSLFQRKSTVTP